MNRSLLAESIFLSVGVLFVLLIFQPFGTEGFDHPYKYEQLIGYGFLVFVSYPLIKWAIYALLSNVLSRWNLQWVSVTASGLLLAIPAFIYYSYVIMGQFVLSWFPSFALFACAIGVPFILLIIYDKWLKEKALSKLVKQGTENNNIELNGENKDETYVFRPSNLLYLQSEGNYVKVIFMDDDTANQVLIRSTLSKLSKQLTEGDFMQTHRSFLVNRKHFTRINQESGKHRLCSTLLSDTVPVSKTFLAEVKRKLKDYS